MRKIAFLILTTINCLMTYGQDTKIIVGFDLTPTVTSLRGNSMTDDYDARFSISTGLTFEYIIYKNISIKSGLAYERKGSKSSIFIMDETEPILENQDIRLNFDYLTLPILVSVATKGKTTLYVNAGPYFGFLLSQKIKYSAVGSYPEMTVDNLDYSRRMDFGLSIGLGLNIHLTKKLLLDLGLRETWGLLNTSKTEVIDDGSIKTNSFGLLLGLKYKL